MPFMETVMRNGHLEDAQRAKQIAEVVFRTMRDLMTTEASDRVAEELHQEQELVPTEAYKPVPDDVGNLWQDTDPVAGFLSRIEKPSKFDSDSFLYRVRQEADIPNDVNPETVVSAVFRATKEELTPERVEEVASFLPDKIQEMWKQA